MNSIEQSRVQDNADASKRQAYYAQRLAKSDSHSSDDDAYGLTTESDTDTMPSDSDCDLNTDDEQNFLNWKADIETTYVLERTASILRRHQRHQRNKRRRRLRNTIDLTDLTDDEPDEQEPETREAKERRLFGSSSDDEPDDEPAEPAEPDEPAEPADAENQVLDEAVRLAEQVLAVGVNGDVPADVDPASFVHIVADPPTDESGDEASQWLPGDD